MNNILKEICEGKIIIRAMQSNRGNNVPNQLILALPSITAFLSYGSLIAWIDKMEETIYLNEYLYDYSRTTGKYRNMFFEENYLYGLTSIKELNKAIKEGKYNNWKIKLCKIQKE